MGYFLKEGKGLDSIGNNYYEVLSIPEKASKSQIRKAYKRLKSSLEASEGNASSELTLELLEEVYQTLKAADSRLEYDNQLLRERNAEMEKRELLVHLRENSSEDSETRVMKRPVLSLFGNLDYPSTGATKTRSSIQAFSVGLVSFLLIGLRVSILE